MVVGSLLQTRERARPVAFLPTVFVTEELSACLSLLIRRSYRARSRSIITHSTVCPTKTVGAELDRAGPPDLVIVRPLGQLTQTN